MYAELLEPQISGIKDVSVIPLIKIKLIFLFVPKTRQEASNCFKNTR